MDVIPDDHPSFFGRPGSIASKFANLIVQNATHLDVVGAKLDYPSTGYNPDGFAPNAERVHLDWTGKCDEWIAQCRAWKEQYPLPESWVDEISLAVGPDDILVASSSGMACEMIAQRFKVKKGQRVIFSPGLGSMGFAIPQAIGVALAAPDRQVYCVEGDGSLQHNIQELGKLKEVPNVKLFILCNNGYASIRNTQQRFNKTLGCDNQTGLSLPETERILDAYGVHATLIHIDPGTEIHPRLKSTINEDGSITPGRLEDVE